MECITPEEAGAKWGMTASRVCALTRDGRVDGARLVGRSWLIPEQAERPLDGRTRQAKKDDPSKPSPYFPLDGECTYEELMGCEGLFAKLVERQRLKPGLNKNVSKCICLRCLCFANLQLAYGN